MSWATESLDLASGDLRLRSLKKSDIDAVAEAIHDPEGWSGRFWGMDSREKIRGVLDQHLKDFNQGECNPFVYFVRGEVAGISRYMHLAPQRRALEIGGTCVAPKWRRTFVNTEVKKLLLAHAFEQLEAVRVELRVDCSNYPSQMNVLRLGATFEGKIRHWQIRKDGQLPDGMLYSITNKEWPAVRINLDDLLERKAPKAPYLPHSLETSRLGFRLYRLSDAEDLLHLVRRNRKLLVDSFPQSAPMETAEDARAYIAERAHWASAGTSFCYGVWDRRTRVQIGQLNLKQVDWKLRSAELGYFVDSEYLRQGIGSEMVNLAVRELFESQDFRRVSLRVIVSNEPGIRFAGKLGFEQEGILRSGFLTGKGECVDTAVFARIRTR